MARPGDVDGVQVVFLDDAVQMGVDEVQSRRRAPVAEQARFDVRQLEQLLQHRIFVEINLPNRKVVHLAPIGVHLGQKFRSEILYFLFSCFAFKSPLD